MTVIRKSNLWDVQTELERILSSKLFKQSHILTNFLKFVVIETIADKSDQIKEYSIAVKALGRPTDFNPQLDALVRIHAGRLRRALHEYYNDEGSNNPIQISIQKGSYVPEFVAGVQTKQILISPTTGGSSGISNHHKRPINIVAVLPFKNLSGLPGNHYMVDGFCEQLSADLARFPEISVISYYSSAKFRNEKIDIRSAGKELDVSHFITGGIYRDTKCIRVSLQLVDAGSGKQLWSRDYTHDLNCDSLYEIFEDILNQIVPKLTGYYGLISRSVAISSQLDPVMNQDIIDAVFWYYHYQIKYTEDIFSIAVQRIEKALQVNPNYALGWAILGQLYIGSVSLSYAAGPEPLKVAERCVSTALQLDPDCQHAYISLGYLNIYKREKIKALEAVAHGLAIQPRSAFFLGTASFFLGLLGEYSKSLEYFERANSLNPYFPWWVNAGQIIRLFYQENYNEALEFAERINIPGVYWNNIFKIAILGQMSRTEEASDLALQYQKQFPGKAARVCLTLKTILFHEVVYNRIKEGLCKAGVTLD
jgi:TolB-like protein